MLAKVCENEKSFDQTKYMPFLIKDEELLNKYNEIWNKFKKFKQYQKRIWYWASDTKNHLKAKIRFNVGKINNNFHDNGMPKENGY